MRKLAIERPFKRRNKVFNRIYEGLGSPGRIAAVDFGSGGIKIIELEKSKTNYRFVSLLYEELTPEARKSPELKKEFYRNFIRQAKESKKITSLDIFAVINNPQIASVLLEIPKVSSSDLSAFIKTQTSKQIPFDSEQNEVFFRMNRAASKESKGGKIKVVSVVVPKILIGEAIDVLKSNAFNIRGIFVASEAIDVLPLYTKAASRRDTYAILDMGYKCSFLNIYRGGILEFIRSVNVAGEHLTASLLRTLTIDDKKIIIAAEDAEKLKQECGFPLDEEKEEFIGDLKKSYIQAMLKPTLDRIINELRRSLNYYSHFLGGREIKKLFITGGSANLLNLDKYLESNLGVEVSKIAPLKIVKGIEELSYTNQEFMEAAQESMSACLGSVLYNPRRINLIPKSLLLEQRLNVFKIASAILVVLVGFMSILFYSLTFGQIYSYQRSLKKVKSGYAKLAPAERLIDKYNKLKAEFRQKKSMISSVINRQPLWSAILKEFTNITPEGVVFKEVLLKNGKVKKLLIKGEVYPLYTTVDVVFSQFITALAASPFFSDVELISRRQDEYSLNPKIKFEIGVKLVY